MPGRVSGAARPGLLLAAAVFCLAADLATLGPEAPGIYSNAEELRMISPVACAPRIEDYTYLWWAHGFRGRSGDGRWLRSVQTGRYAMALDVESVRIPHLGVIPSPLPYLQALVQDNSVFASLPPAELDLVITVDGIEYTCAEGGRPTWHTGPRVVESGRFLQRADITDLVFRDRAGRELPVDARFETVAWPDWLALILEARPRGPQARWSQASMAVRLRTGRHEVRSEWRAGPGEVWAGGERRSAGVALVPGAEGMQPAPERDGVGVEVTGGSRGGPCGVEYDAVRGWYRVELEGMARVGEHNDTLRSATVRLTNPGREPAVVRLLFEQSASAMHIPGVAEITGVSVLLRDGDGFPLGLPVQISKNWHRQPELDLRYQGVWLHAFTLLRVPAHSRVELELVVAHAHWGGVPAASHAQLCLIGWGSNQVWNQSAIGAWGESICYEPDQAQAECGVLDVRPLMVYGWGTEGPRPWSWTNNVGGGDFFRCFDADGARQYPARVRTAYRRNCPNLTEVTYAGQSYGGKLEHRATVSIHRTDDIVRGIYRLRLDVVEPADVSRFVILQIGADTYSYTGEQRIAMGDEGGVVREWQTQWGGDRYRTEPMECRGGIPWISLHEAVVQGDARNGAWANRGLVIRHWDALLGGEKTLPWIAERGVRARGEDTSLVDILPPPGVTRLLPGDYVEATIEHLVVPQYAGDYYGPNRNLRAALERHENTWRMVHREAVGNDLEVAVSRGALLSVRPTAVRARGDRAEFAITGGLGYVPITIAGLSGYREPVLEMREGGGRWRLVDQSVHGRDFWQADYDPDAGAWDITYTVPLDSPEDARVRREFRFRLQGGQVCAPKPHP